MGSLAMQGAMVIDDKGEIWPLGAPQLRAVLIPPGVIPYAVRNLGYVLLRQEARTVRAQMRPRLVRPATLIGLHYVLLDLMPQRILLSRLAEEGDTHELFHDVSEFLATVERDIGDDEMQRRRPAYALSPRSLLHLERARYARFAPVVALWGAARGYLPGDLLTRLRREGAPSRVALLRNPVGTGRLVYEHVGSGYTFAGNACLPLLLIGQDIEMLPDRDYGDWAAGSYHQCLADQKPRLETVSAVMRRPDGQRVWSYYDRVLLPWRDRDGTRFVLGLSEVRRRALAA
ncbi:MAG: hypothetical protein ACLQJR_01450 [Stellaceae bacterium]